MVSTGIKISENFQFIDARITGRVYDVTEFMDGIIIGI